MRREDIADLYRLSPVQQGILFHSLAAPGGGVYFEQFNVRYDEGFRPEAFVEAWRKMVERHPVLRTAILWENLDEPVQVVAKQAGLPVEHLDLRGLAPDEQRARLLEALAADRRRGFDLRQAPLLRLTLLRLSEASYHVIWSYHHLILDGWSAGLVMREVLLTYQGLLSGTAPALEARRPFREYIVWQRAQDATAIESQWRQMLAGFRAPNVLGIDRAGEGGGHEVGEYGVLVRRLPEAATARLKSFAQEHRLTLNTLVQGAWALTVARYSGREDVVYGTTAAGRPATLAGVDGMIGCFINTLPLRLETPASVEVLPWLRDLQARLLALRKLEHTPLVDVARWSEVPRPLPLFETLLVFESFTPDAYFEMSDTGAFQRTNYPLTLVVADERELLLRVGYERARFETVDIEGLLACFATVLAALPASPTARLGALPFLPAEELATRAAWNAVSSLARGEHEGSHTAVARFASTAAERPDAVALVCREEHLSSGELAARVAVLAERLRASGVGAEFRVGIFCERSPEMVTAALAVHAAGAAYVPLDPAFPPSRLAYSAADAGLSALLTQPALAEAAAELLAEAGLAVPEHAVPVLAVTSDSAPASPLRLEPVAPENLAYVIYTSGSTGKPKGVEIEQDSLASFLRSMGRAPGLSASDRLLAVTTLSFDIAALELFLPLVTGARLVIAPREALADADRLAALLAEERISVLQATPATWRMLLESETWKHTAASGEGLGDQGGPRSARSGSGFAAATRLLEGHPGPLLDPRRSRLRALCGGEALPRELAARLLPEVAELWNLYGPTETTIWSAALPVEPGEGAIPIGGLVDHTQFHLLDARGRPVPPGVPGELAIGGRGLARGYHGRPALTAERFMPDEAASEPGARLYRTGDLARFQADGKLEFLGRLDHQVKIRGFRIELGEIESVLGKHPALDQAVVVARPQTSGDARLVAYIRARHLPTVADLRAWLLRELPEYMVPAAFVEMDSWPLTPNGKIDRKALPEPGELRPALAGRFVGPRDALELSLVRLWEEVLGRAPVGVTDDFFELGGHSLLAVGLVGRLRRQLGVELNPAALLAERTVEALAARLRQNQNQDQAPARSALVPLQPKGSRPPLFLVHPVGGHVLCYAELARRLGPDQPVFGLQRVLEQPGEIASVEALAGRYLGELLRRQPEGPYRLGGWSMGGVLAVEMARQLGAAGYSVEAVFLLDAHAQPASLGPLPGDDAGRVALFAADLARQSGAESVPDAATLREAPAGDPVAAALAWAREAGLLPRGLDLTAARELLAVFAANLETLARHAPRPVEVPLTLLAAAASGPAVAESWRGLATAGLELVSVDVDHYGLLTGAGLETVSALLAARLAPAAAEPRVVETRVEVAP